MNRYDKQQTVDEFIHCKVSHFKNDLIEQVRRFIENDEQLANDLLDLNLKHLTATERFSKLSSINKRKFSSSEDDDEHDKLDSNSSSMESNAKSPDSDEALNLNRILNNWNKSTIRSENENHRDQCSTSTELECDEKLIDQDRLTNRDFDHKLIKNGLSINNSITNHPLLSPNSTASPSSHRTTLSSQNYHLRNIYDSPDNASTSESIEKSFNETFSCLNGISVQLIGNIRLQLTNPQNSITSSAILPTDSSASSLDQHNAMFNNSLLMINESMKNDLNNNHKNHKNTKQQSTDLSNSPVDSRSNCSDLNNSSSGASSCSATASISNSSGKCKEIELECKEDELMKNNQNFKIDQLIRDHKMSRTPPVSGESVMEIRKLINQQLSVSNDSSSSTLSAVSIDLSNSITQRSSHTNSTNSGSSTNTIRRRSSGSTTSACSIEPDCVTPPSRKHLKTENSATPFTSNQSLNLITSLNNASINLETSPYLSPSLPQQLNDLLSPGTKKSHLNSDLNFVDQKLASPNFHQKSNQIPTPKTSNNKIHCKTSATNNSGLIANRKLDTLENIATNAKIKRILESYQQLASSSMNGPEYYENLALLANFHQRYGLKKLDPITAKIASAASAFLNGDGPVPDATLLMNELTRLQLSRSEESKSEIANLSISTLENYLNKSYELMNFKSSLNNESKSNPTKGTGKLSFTILENERISCFNVGGEERLCLPQILTTVLRNFSLPDIENVCDQFKIFCSPCNSQQLNMLKAANIIPQGVPSCGLFTKSDAERLCALLFFNSNLLPKKCKSKEMFPFYLSNNDRLDDKQIEEQQRKLKLELKESKFIQSLNKELPDEIRRHIEEDSRLSRQQIIQTLKSTLSFEVMHHCFGKCKGFLIPAFYVRYDSRCILCTECQILLSPNKFVLHTHQFENQTCHWGFDSSNWRNLITLTKRDLSNPKMEMLKKYLNEFKFHKICSKSA